MRFLGAGGKMGFGRPTTKEFYIGGNFTTADGTTVNRIVKIENDGTVTALGTGMNGTVYDIVLDSFGNLYAAGSFTTVDGSSANRIAKWDGSSWSALSSGMGSNPGCPALAIDKNDIIYAGGYWTTLGDGSTANYTSKWDGTAWSSWINMNNSVEFITVVEK